MWMGRALLREQDTCTFDLHVFFAFSLFSKGAHVALCLFGHVFSSCDLLLAFIFLVFFFFFFMWKPVIRKRMRTDALSKYTLPTTQA
jgi:hypothetical protein